MYPYDTYDKNLEMIQPLVEELLHFFYFDFGPWWPSKESDRTEIWSVRSGDRPIAPAVTKCDLLTVPNEL
jgi:hypothetical protein